MGHAPLPWERVLWSGRPLRLVARLKGEHFFLTEFRLIRVTRDRSRRSPGAATADQLEEIVLHDIGEVQRTESRLDRALGTSTIIVHPRRRGAAPLVVAGIRHGAAFAALLELLAGDPQATADVDSVRAALAWTPQPIAGYTGATGALAAIAIAIVSVVVGLHGSAAPIVYTADDALEPGGMKKNRAEIVRFMESEVMPWARVALGRIKGGPERVTCETCHGRNPAARDWQMPAVAALPLPIVRERGWETYRGGMDAQMRNAIYGYVAESDNQSKAAYMREIVVPGMARLLHRPAYDFTRTYDYNRSRRALGCYHCHRVSVD
jgi:hypothetical protein